MSLILDALRKLEREKRTPPRGFLVLTHAPWPERRRASLRALWWLGPALLVGLGWWFLRTGPIERASAPRVAVPEARSEGLPRLAQAPDAAPVWPSAAGQPRPEASRSILSPLPVPNEAMTFPPAGLLPESAASTEAPAPASPLDTLADSQAPPGSPVFVLQAISQQDGRPVALLNERLVREGDVFDGVRILRIGADEVEIEVAGERRIVRF